MNVTHDLNRDSTLQVNWQLRNTSYSDGVYLLQRNTGIWQTIDSLESESGTYIESGLTTSEMSFEYRITHETACEQSYYSRDHLSILLKIEAEHNLDWNSYQGWLDGVEEYIIERNVDGHGWRELATTSSNSFVYHNDTVGFDHCFRIKALEQGGNKSFAYSNIACDFFIPELYAYNIITPNGDSKNEHFVITNVEFYPQGRLQIFNRWGVQVYDQIGYRNNWHGQSNGSFLPNGVYFYVFELNEPRVHLKQVSGQVSILR